MATATIRVSLRTRALLQELAQTAGSSMQTILDQALEPFRRQQLLEATSAVYAALHAAPEAWKNLAPERQTWDQTLADGLEETCMSPLPNRGEIWLANLNPTRDHD